MQVGDLVKVFTGKLGVIAGVIKDDWGTHGPIYVVYDNQGKWVHAVGEDLEAV